MLMYCACTFLNGVCTDAHAHSLQKLNSVDYLLAKRASLNMDCGMSLSPIEERLQSVKVLIRSLSPPPPPE